MIFSSIIKLAFEIVLQKLIFFFGFVFISDVKPIEIMNYLIQKILNVLKKIQLITLRKNPICRAVLESAASTLFTYKREFLSPVF
jgi:hypothetical protein